MCVRACGGQRSASAVSLIHSSALFLETASLTEPGVGIQTRLDYWATELQESAGHLPRHFQCAAVSGLFLWSWLMVQPLCTTVVTWVGGRIPVRCT